MSGGSNSSRGSPPADISRNYFTPSAGNLGGQQWMNEYLNFRRGNNGLAAVSPENMHPGIGLDDMGNAYRQAMALGPGYQWRQPTPEGMQEYWVNGRPVMSQAGVDPDIARLKAIGADTSRYEQQLADFGARNDAMTAWLKQQRTGLLQQNPSPQQAGLLGGPPRW